jgi:hypothetical protein
LGYGELWKLLDHLVFEFRKRGETVPPEVIEDLRAAKTMIEVLKTDPTRAENIPSIEMYVGNVESYLILRAHQRFGAQFADNWMNKLRETRKTIRIGAEEKALESPSKFIAGVPKDQKWLRVQVSSETPENEIKRLASESGLSTKMQQDGFVLVYGDGEKLKVFIQKTGEKFQRKKEL